MAGRRRDGPGVGEAQSGDQLDQGGLAGSGGSGDRGQSGPSVQVDTGQDRLDRPGIGVGHLAHLHGCQRRRGASPAVTGHARPGRSAGYVTGRSRSGHARPGRSAGSVTGRPRSGHARPGRSAGSVTARPRPGRPGNVRPGRFRRDRFRPGNGA